MNSPALSPPINGELGLGEPFDRRAALLIAYNDARRELQRVQVDGTSDDILATEWTVAEKLGDIEAHEHHLATAFVMALRFALRHCMASLSDLLSEVPTVVELADAVADLETKGGRR